MRAALGVLPWLLALACTDSESTLGPDASRSDTIPTLSEGGAPHDDGPASDAGDVGGSVLGATRIPREAATPAAGADADSAQPGGANADGVTPSDETDADAPKSEDEPTGGDAGRASDGALKDAGMDAEEFEEPHVDHLDASSGCDANCSSTCRDGARCDAGSGDAGDSCTNGCALADCGDGIVQAGEECDTGDDNSDSDPNACRTDCTLTTVAPSTANGTPAAMVWSTRR